MGTAVRFIYSNLNSGQFSSGQDPRAGTAVSADVSAYYTNDMELLNDDARLALGVNISNIGSKIGYVEGGSRSFLPTNLKVGSATTFYWSNSSEFTFALDLNKLLVPSPPEIANKTGPSGPFFSFASPQRHTWWQKMMQRNSWEAFSPYTSRSLVFFGFPLESPDEVSLSHHHH